MVFIIGVRRTRALTEVNGSKSLENRQVRWRATPDHRGTTGAVGALDERAGFPYDRKPRSMSRIFVAHASYCQPGPPSLSYMPLHIALSRITEVLPDAVREAHRYTSPARIGAAVSIVSASARVIRVAECAST
ncbi:hypothetical protein [Burkholderia lata]|uniref:hypothetical protein n=1 Tax=Burkholderia lata (strain ATCC 17760 / DSM 23089 / LMG 22485 / NCIMB 9086 / R18194 / 383) TaxID=482957 RepID=UPI001582B2DE